MKNIIEPGSTDDNMAHAHCMLDTQGKNTHSEYVIPITFPLQQRLQERVPILRYTYIACLVLFHILLTTTLPCPTPCLE